MQVYIHIIAKMFIKSKRQGSTHSYIFLKKEYNKYGSALPHLFFRGFRVTVNDAVAKRIVELLTEKNMTQYRLEQLSGIQHGHMQWILSGKSKTVTLSTVFRLANGFDMTVIEFLNDDKFLFNNLDVE